MYRSTRTTCPSSKTTPTPSATSACGSNIFI